MLIGKPLAAMVVVAMTGYPVKTALVVGIGLAQIGEFSFILSDLGRSYGLVKDEAHNVIVACAIVSITLNPILFRMRDRFEAMLQRQPTIWKWLNFRAERRAAKINAKAEKKIEANEKPVAVVCGYGPVGRSVDQLLREGGLETVIVDQNVDTVQSLTKQGRLAIFGDASNVEVLAPAPRKRDAPDRHPAARGESTTADRGGEVDQAEDQDFRSKPLRARA